MSVKSTVYEFEGFRFDAESGRLFRAETGELVALQPKAAELLLVLIESGGRVLSKNEILSAVWAESFVEESNLSQTIFVLRKALGEDKKDPRFIVTIPGRGYRFIAKVTENAESAETIEESPKAEIRNPESRIPNPAPQIPLAPKYFLIGVGFLILLIGGGIFYAWRNREPETIREVKSIAVLPFKNTGGKEDEEYIGHGLSEVLVSRLSNIKTIIVRPANSVLKFTQESPDIKRIGKELNVEAVITGRVQMIDGNIRVTVQVVRVSDSATLWAETFDDKFDNIFAVQDSISARVTESLALELSPDERERVAKNYTTNPEALQAYMRGLYFWNKRTSESLGKALGEFETAVRLDPNYALAYSGLASCYVLLAEYRVMSPNESFPKARAAASKALELDGRLAEAQTSLAYIAAFYEWDFPTAERDFKKAIDQNPSYATAHQWYAEYLQVRGRFDESLVQLRRAETIDPVSLIIKTDIARYFYFTGKYDAAIEQSNKIIELDPNFAWGYGFLWVSYKEKGMLKESVEYHMKAETMFGRSLAEMEARRAAFARAGWKGYWEEWLAQSDAPAVRPYIQAIEKAIIYNELGNEEKTLEFLEKSFERREHWLLYVKFAPQFDNLQNNPRFQQLLRRMNL
jgi:TolB-like protein/DNA-binding winged helix-turn-helix (wHTH) protein/Tfp pilus assembly protein PilF